MLMDASVLVDLFVPSENDERIRTYLESQGQTPVVSDFGAGEFAGAIKRRICVGLMRKSEAEETVSRFDAWCASSVEQVATEPGDIRLAGLFVRRFDVRLRMPDAMYVALAHRLGVALCSFDVEQRSAARQFGVAVADIP